MISASVAMSASSLPSDLVAQRFQVERTAGSGGMGTVYCARDLRDGSLVALKVLRLAGGSPADAERFAREAGLLSSLQHPGIVRYIAHGQTTDGSPFLAMEWLEGEDLEQLLKRRSLSLTESLLLIRIVAQALAVAHQQGIIHRDRSSSSMGMV